MLQVDIQTNGFELTPALEDLVEKTSRKIAQVDDRITLLTASLAIQKRKDDNGCSVTYKVDRPGKNILVKETGDDLYQVLSQIAQAVVREVRKEKEKERQTAHP